MSWIIALRHLAFLNKWEIILTSIEKLAEFPTMCPIIPKISNNVREYRKLVVSKEISVIYWIEDDYINVSFIWDTRRSLHHIYNIFKD